MDEQSADRHEDSLPESGGGDMEVAGQTVVTDETVSSSAAWAVAGHESGGDCGEEGGLRQLAKGQPAPACPRCHKPVTWRLELLAPSAAAIDPSATTAPTEPGGAPPRQGPDAAF